MKINHISFTVSLLVLLVLQTPAFAQKGRIMIQQDRIWTYADLSGKPIMEGEKRWKIYSFDPSGVALVDNRGFQIIDADGNRVKTNPESFKTTTGFFGMGTTFSEGFLRVEIDRKWGMMNNKGELVIQAIYDKISIVQDGYAIGTKDGEFFTLTPGGKANKIDHPEIKNFSPFLEGLAAIQTSSDGWGFVNTAGKMVITPQFASVGYFSNGIAWAKTNDKTVGFIDKNGAWVIEAKFQVAKEMDPKSGIALVRMNDKWQYTNSSGKLTEMDKYDKLYSFSDGLAMAQKGDSIGYISPDGTWAIEAKFSAAKDFVNGLARAQQNDKWGVIDKKGNWVLEPKFDALKDPVILK